MASLSEPREEEEEQFGPRFTHVMSGAGVYCGLLKASIHPGGSVVVGIGGGVEEVGRVLETSSHDKVLVQWCPRIDYKKWKKQPLSEEAFRSNVELYQGCDTAIVSSSSILSVAFVFTLNYIEENNVDTSGILNVHTIRYRKTFDNEQLVDIPAGAFLPFPSCYSRHENRFCLHRELWQNLKLLRRSLTSALNRKDGPNDSGPVGVSYTREATNPLYWHLLCEQVKGNSTFSKEANKRGVKMTKMHPHLKQESYREPRPIEHLQFSTEAEIKCLRSRVGNMIGFGMPEVPSLAVRFKDLGENDTCHIVLCSEIPSPRPAKLDDVGIRLTFDGVYISVRIIYHRIIFNKLSVYDQVANDLQTLNNRVSNPEIDATEDHSLIPLSLTTKFFFDGIRYRLTSLADEANVQGIAIHPPSVAGSPLPPNISTQTIQNIMLQSIGAGARERALVASHRLDGNVNN